jgi:hypothetical protein
MFKILGNFSNIHPLQTACHYCASFVCFLVNFTTVFNMLPHAILDDIMGMAHEFESMWNRDDVPYFNALCHHVRRSHVVDLLHVKEPYEHDRCPSAKFSGHVSHPRFTCFATRCLLAWITDVHGGRIRWLESG